MDADHAYHAFFEMSRCRRPPLSGAREALWVGLESSWDPLDLSAGLPQVEEPDEVLGHQDIAPDNVVFREGQRCALLASSSPGLPPGAHLDGRAGPSPDGGLRRCLRSGRSLTAAVSFRIRGPVPAPLAPDETPGTTGRGLAEDVGRGGVGDLVTRRVVWLETTADRITAAMA